MSKPGAFAPAGSSRNGERITCPPAQQAVRFGGGQSRRLQLSVVKHTTFDVVGGPASCLETSPPRRRPARREGLILRTVTSVFREGSNSPRCPRATGFENRYNRYDPKKVRNPLLGMGLRGSKRTPPPAAILASIVLFYRYASAAAVKEGRQMNGYEIIDYFTRKWRITVLTVLSYAALC